MTVPLCPETELEGTNPPRLASSQNAAASGLRSPDGGGGAPGDGGGGGGGGGGRTVHPDVTAATSTPVLLSISSRTIFSASAKSPSAASSTSAHVRLNTTSTTVAGVQVGGAPLSAPPGHDMLLSSPTKPSAHLRTQGGPSATSDVQATA